jgi:ABC-type Fe3+-hydroxamate transport system substrate-binding protein
MLKTFALSLMLIAGLAFCTQAKGKPIAITQSQGATITLTDDAAKCDAVPKFVYRIIWEEKGKRFEGCFGVHGPIIVAYFPGDKSIALMPAQVFQPLSSM